MPKAKPLSDEELLSAISSAEQSAIGDIQGTISTDRADAVARYLGKDYTGALAAPTGRSSVVSRDVSDVVQGVLANVLKPFVGGEQMVEFQAHSPEDEQAAKQETDYVNFVAMERNNGFVVLSTAMNDALLLRTGYVKCGWAKRTDVVIETYQGQSDEELALLSQDQDVEITQHSEYPDPYASAAAQMQQPQAPAMAMVQGQVPSEQQPPQIPMLHDVRVRRTRPTEYVETVPTPPDEIIVSQRAREPSLQNVDFVQHRTHKTLSELRQAGYDVPDDIGNNDQGDGDRGESLEDFARNRWGRSSGNMYDDPTQDPARRIVMFKETYIRIDRDGDGIAELRKVCQVGMTILSDEETDIVPLVCFSAILMSHRHIGLSVYDLVQDLAQIKTALMRQYLDNKYLSNNGRTAVNVNAVNIDDMLVSRPGGVIRVDGDPNTAMMPFITPDTGASALQGLQYLDDVREGRTGYTRQSQGLDGDALSDSKTLGGMQIQMSQSQLRLEMMTRTIAETGIRDMFKVIHALTLKHSTRAEKVRLRNKWVAVNPREWVRRTDLSISVGMGNAVPGMQMQNLMMMAQAQDKAFALGLTNPEKVYNLLTKMTNAAGFKNEEEFFSPPRMEPVKGPDGQPQIGEDGKPKMQAAMPPPQPSPQEKVAQINAQTEMQKAQMVQQGDAQKFQATQQSDAQRFQAEQHGKAQQLAMEHQAKASEQQNAFALQQSNDQRQAQLDAMQHDRELQRMALEDQFKRDQMAQEFAFKHWEAEQKLATQIKVAQMRPAPQPRA